MIGANFDSWNTLPIERTIMVAVHTATCEHRLRDVLALLNGDTRIQRIYTQVPDRMGDGVDQLLRDRGGRVVPWQDAVEMSTDLVIAASLHQLEKLPAKRRLAVPHGAGYSKRWSGRVWRDPHNEAPVYGLDRDSLIGRHEQVIVDALVLSHENQLQILAAQCREALPSAVVVGDPCLDALLANQHNRPRYRRALRVGVDQILVAVTSTWGPDSLIARHPRLLSRLMAELPGRHRVIATLHPGVWSQHGREHVLSALRAPLEAGLELVDAGEDWRGLLLAADFVVGDHSSVISYAAAVGVPILFSHVATKEVAPDSVIAALSRVGPVIRPDVPLPDQLTDALHEAAEQRKLGDVVADHRGSAGIRLRRTIYEQLALSEPTGAPIVTPIPPPGLVAPRMTV